MCDMHLYVWHDSFICVTWLIRMCDMTHSYVGHDSFICVTWLMLTRDTTPSNVWYDSFVCVTWPTHMCVTWLTHMCDMTHGAGDSTVVSVGLLNLTHRHSHSYVTHVSQSCQPLTKRELYDEKLEDATCVTWLTHMRDMTDSHWCHYLWCMVTYSFICVACLIHRRLDSSISGSVQSCSWRWVSISGSAQSDSSSI